ncbi:MAG: porin [Alphaproteobacteria bacterium]|nr:porin [Alphaproteobacteria bacterium]
MKKILLGTTGLIGAALLSAAAHAETPKVTLGGFADFQAGQTSDDRDDNNRGHGFRNDNEISVRVDGKTDGGLGYGAVIDLETDITDNNNNSGGNATRTFTYLEGNWGRFEMGGNRGATAAMGITAGDVAVATGGIDGDWTNFTNVDGTIAVPGATLAASGGFITKAKGFADHGVTTALGDENFYNSTKVSYYSPKFSGFQVGASYTPDMEDRGQTVARVDNAAGQFGEIFEIALGFDHQFENGLKLGAAGTYENGDHDTAANEDIRTYSIGALLGYQGWSAAASYGSWGDSGRAVNTNNDDSDFWTLGAGYETGPFGLSATYLNSTRETGATTDNDFTNFVVGADYKLAPGLTPYAEVSFYEFDQGGAGGFDNDGTTFLLGTQVAF